VKIINLWDLLVNFCTEFNFFLDHSAGIHNYCLNEMYVFSEKIEIEDLHLCISRTPGYPVGLAQV
jgi:hypothetical protein